MKLQGISNYITAMELAISAKSTTSMTTRILEHTFTIITRVLERGYIARTVGQALCIPRDASDHFTTSQPKALQGRGK